MRSISLLELEAADAHWVIAPEHCTGIQNVKEKIPPSAR